MTNGALQQASFIDGPNPPSLLFILHPSSFLDPARCPHCFAGGNAGFQLAHHEADGTAEAANRFVVTARLSSGLGNWEVAVEAFQSMAQRS